MWVKVGSADEARDEAGLAHVHEHMLFKGTKRRGIGAIAQDVEASGGEINAWTSYDQTVYHLVLASMFFDTGLDILQDAIMNSTFDAGELEKELEVILEETKRGEDNPSVKVSETLFSEAYRKHPYRRPIIGTPKSVKSFTRDKILDFYRRWYIPQNMVLVVVGDFDSQSALKKIHDAFKDFRQDNPAARAERPAEPEQRRTKIKILREDFQEGQLAIAFHIPDVSHPDIYATDLLSVLLGQGDSSRFAKQIKRQAGLVNDIYAYSYTPMNPGIFVAGASLDAAKTERATKAILKELFRLKFERISEEELQKARGIIESDVVYQRETVQGQARKLGYFEVLVQDLEFEEKYLRRLSQVTPKELQEVARRIFTPENLTMVTLLPKKVKRELTEEKIGFWIKDAHDKWVRSSKRSKAVRSSNPVIRHRLDNGLTLLMIRDDTIPIASMRAVFKGGLLYENSRNNGINYLLAEMVTKGTSNRNADEVARAIDSIGGTLSGHVMRDSFSLRADCLSRHFDKGLELLADCILHPAFDEEVLEKERNQALQELMNLEDNLASFVFKRFIESLFKGHPYQRTLLGTQSSLSRLSKGQLQHYYKKHYRPEDMCLAIVGDIEPRAVSRQVAQLFNHSSKKRSNRPTAGKGQLIQEFRIAEAVREKQQGHMVLGFLGTTVFNRDRYALEVLTSVLSGQGGRLFIELRDKQSLAYSISSISMEGIEPGYLAVYMGTSPEKLPQAIRGIREQFRLIRNEKVAAGELERVKRYLIGTHAISLQKTSARAAIISYNECYGLGYNYHRKYISKINAITSEDLLRVARKYIDLEKFTIAVVRPSSTEPVDEMLSDLGR